jgi:hypothetical protein
MDTREGGTSLSHWPPLHVLLAPPHLCFPLGGILSTDACVQRRMRPRNADGFDRLVAAEDTSNVARGAAWRR